MTGRNDASRVIYATMARWCRSWTNLSNEKDIVMTTASTLVLGIPSLLRDIR